jgi:hypothetical protein
LQHGYIITTDYMPHFFAAESPIEELDMRVSYALAGAYLAFVGLMLLVLKPGKKTGIASGKPFEGKEAGGLAMVKRWASKKQIILTKTNLASFLKGKISDAAKSDKAAKEAASAKALIARDDEDILGRLNAELALTIDVGGAKLVYNAYQVGFNVIMVYIIMSEIWKFADGDIMKVWATPIVTGAAGRMYAFGLWLHYVNKFLEFADTIFMGLAGSWRQMTRELCR